MLAIRIIPTLLFRGKTLVKGQRFNAWRSVGDVMQAAEIYAARGVDELVLLDIAATPEGRGPDCKMIEQIAAKMFSPLTVGGGVRSAEDVRDLLNAGADKVSVCTTAVRWPNVIEEAAGKFGSQAIVAAVDERDWHVVTDCGKEIWPSWEALPWCRELADTGAGEILLTSVDREGTMQGYDLDLIEFVSNAVSIPVIAHGGCSGPEDMLAAIKAGASAVAAGALFQFTDYTPRQCAEYLGANGVEVRL